MMSELSKIFCASLGLIAATASAEAQPAPAPAVVTTALPAPRLATVFEFKVSLPEGKGLARVLLDAGVGSDDAAQAARLAAGHCDSTGGCNAKISISHQLGAGIQIERLVLADASGQTVIERRNGRLALNPHAVAPNRTTAFV
jgi:hypothetical protein